MWEGARKEGTGLGRAVAPALPIVVMVKSCWAPMCAGLILLFGLSHSVLPLFPRDRKSSHFADEDTMQGSDSGPLTVTREVAVDTLALWAGTQ